MKKIYFGLITLAVLALSVSCSKEQDVVTPSNEENEKIITISASIDESTKTTYTEDGDFSWIKGDMISYVVRSTLGNSPTYKYDRYQYTANTVSSDGKNATLTGYAPSGQWSAADVAYYPYLGDSYSANTLDIVKTTTTLQAKLSGTIKAYPDRLQGIIPMIGKKTGSDASGTVEHYHFYPVTGILKVSFSNLPATANKIQLELPDDNTYALYGNFDIVTSRDIPEIKASDCSGTKYGKKHIQFDYSSPTDAFYFPIPTGTIPAEKLTISVAEGSKVLYSVTNKININLVRGEITELPTIDIDFPSSVTIDGSATAPVVHMTMPSGHVLQFGITNAANNVPGSYAEGARFTNVTQYDWTMADAYKPTSSGEWFFHYTISKGTKVKKVGYVPFYFLSATDKNAYTGQYQMTYDTNSTTSLTLESSDDASKGNIMLTEFAGLTGKLYTTYPHETDQFTDANLVFAGTWAKTSLGNHYIYSADNADGSNYKNAIWLNLGADTSADANFDNKNWALTSESHYLIDEGTTKVSYAFLRGNVIRDSYTVAGASNNTSSGENDDIFGKAWDPTITNNDLVYNPVTDLYSKDFTVPAGTDKAEFKVVKDHAWSPAWPSGNYVVDIDETLGYDATLTINFNASTKDVSASVEYVDPYLLYVKQEELAAATGTQWASNRSVYCTKFIPQIADEGGYKRFIIPTGLLDTTNDLYYKGGTSSNPDEQGCEVKVCSFNPVTGTKAYYYKTNGFEIVEESASYSTASTRIWACMPLSWGRDELKMWVWGGSSLDTSGDYVWSNMKSMTLLSDTKYDNCQWFYIDVPIADQTKIFSWKFVWNNGSESTQDIASKKPSNSLYFKLTGNNYAVAEITF